MPGYDHCKESRYYLYQDNCESPPHVNKDSYQTNQCRQNQYGSNICSQYITPYPDNQINNGIPYNPYNACEMGIIYADRDPNSRMTWNTETIQYQKDKSVDSSFDPVKNNIINGGWFYNINPQQMDNKKICEHSFFNHDQTQPCQYSTIAIPTESTLLLGCRRC